MADLLDLLTARRQGSSTTATATQQSLPEWYTSFIRDLAARGSQVAGTPYQQYEGARVAGFSPLQQQAFQMAPGAATSFQPGLDQARGALSQILPNFQAGAADARSISDQAVQLAAQGSGQANSIASGAGAGAIRSANDGTQGALSAVQQFGLPGAQAAVGAAGAANAALSGPAATWSASARDGYTSPYTSSVVDEIGRLGTRNLTENIMPAINGSFIGSGQFGSQANADIIGRSIRDAQADISGKQASALESGYRTAADIFGADASRGTQLAQTRANTALQGGQLASGALGQLASLGSSTALGAGQLGTTANINAGQLGTNTAIQGAQLGTSALGQAGQQVGQLATQGGALGVQTAGALGQLAANQQTMGLNGINELNTLGGQQQQNQQQGLDTAYADFLRAQGYDMSQLTSLRGLISGLQLPGGASTVSNAPNGAYSASPADWIGAFGNLAGSQQPDTKTIPTTQPGGRPPSK